MSRKSTELAGLGMATGLANSIGEVYAAGLTALAGGGTSGTALTGTLNVLATVATSGDSAKLPLLSTIDNGCIKVFNRGAATAHIYANTGDNIDGGTASSFVTLAAGKSRTFDKVSNTAWQSMLGA